MKTSVVGPATASMVYQLDPFPIAPGSLATPVKPSGGIVQKFTYLAILDAN